MGKQELQERLDAATDGLVGDLEPVRRLVAELGKRLWEAQGELAGLDAAMEGELTALEARALARRKEQG
jgi:hypothetical protein